MKIYYEQISIVGSVVECSPATRAARVRFPDDAMSFRFPNPRLFFSSDINWNKNRKSASRCFSYKILTVGNEIEGAVST